MQGKPVRNDNTSYLPEVFTKKNPNRYNNVFSMFLIFVLFIKTKFLVRFLTIHNLLHLYMYDVM